DTVVGCAGSEASHAGLLLVHGDRLRGHRFVGFDPSLDASAIDVALSDSGVMADAVLSGAAATSHAAERDAPPPFAALPDGGEAIAVPISMGGQVVAVLYADQES